MKNRAFLYGWRMLILAIMIVFYLTKVISLDIFLAMIVGIIIFNVIPETTKALKDKKEGH